MTVYDLIEILRKNSFPLDGVNNRLKDELLSYSYGSESILISNLCQAAAGLGTGLENVRKENEILKKKNRELEKRVKELELEKNKFLLDYQAEKEKVAIYEKSLNEFKGGNSQRMLVENGKKIAYKASAGEKEVLELLQKGHNKTEIAEILGISRNTVHNRIKSLEKSGIL